ncbi:uncharacterized protein [Drosophila tropicalis]|uniref:uncharacterized protein n=1 Tax=Drosophila tropicalis TaxID=46794 RepID=UPI0035AC1245
MSSPAKLRFALITEDVLEKLRPRDQSESPAQVKSAQMNEIYTTITATVSEMLEQKLQSLNLNKLIEDKVLELLARQPAMANRPSGDNPDNYAAFNQHCHDDKLIRKTHSASSVHGLRRHKKRRAKSGAATDTVLADKPKTKLRKMLTKSLTVPKSSQTTTKPVNRSTQLTPPPTPPTTTTTKQTTANTPQQQQQQQPHHLPNERNTVEEPSILTLAAKYLQELDESRRKQRQSPDHF